jgi:hypothetical protein
MAQTAHQIVINRNPRAFREFSIYADSAIWRNCNGDSAGATQRSSVGPRITVVSPETQERLRESRLAQDRATSFLAQEVASLKRQHIEAIHACRELQRQKDEERRQTYQALEEERAIQLRIRVEEAQLRLQEEAERWQAQRMRLIEERNQVLGERAAEAEARRLEEEARLQRDAEETRMQIERLRECAACFEQFDLDAVATLPCADFYCAEDLQCAYISDPLG